MSREELYRSIGMLDESLIDESECAGKTRQWGRLGGLAACAALAVLIAAAGIGYLQSGEGNRSKNPPAGNGQELAQTQRETESEHIRTTEGRPEESQGQQPGIDRGPVRYSDLQLAKNPMDGEIAELFADAGSSASIKEFEESMLENCAGIVEGTVTDIYIKTYRYQTEYDKFGESGVFDQERRSVVYELKVDKTWYGEERTGQTIRIEDSMFFAEEMFAIREGHRYVIPFEEVGDTAYVLPNQVGGDLMRDSRYSTLYEFHPQIEVTLDGCYVVSKDWESLYKGEVREIVIDQEFGENSLASYYRNRMGLLSADEFARRMEKLLAGLDG